MSQRTPQTIAAEISDIHAKANTAFVPANLVRAAELQVEFNASICEALEHAGVLDVVAPDEQPAQA